MEQEENDFPDSLIQEASNPTVMYRKVCLPPPVHTLTLADTLVDDIAISEHQPPTLLELNRCTFGAGGKLMALLSHTNLQQLVVVDCGVTDEWALSLNRVRLRLLAMSTPLA